MKDNKLNLQIIVGIMVVFLTVCVFLILLAMGFKPNNVSINIGPVGIDFATPSGGPFHVNIPTSGAPSIDVPNNIHESPNITNAHLSADVSDTAKVDAYSPSASGFYCYFYLNNAPDSTVVKGVWTLVSAEGYESNSEIDSVEITGGDNTYYFSLGGGTDEWPVGTYKIDLYVDGELVETIEFEVQ